MTRGLLKKIMHTSLEHGESLEYAKTKVKEYSIKTTSELQKIIDEYDSRSPLRRFFASDKDIINYQVAEGIIKRRKETESR